MVRRSRTRDPADREAERCRFNGQDHLTKLNWRGEVLADTRIDRRAHLSHDPHAGLTVHDLRLVRQGQKVSEVDLLESQTDKPLMFMFSEPNEGINDPVIENAEGIAYTLMIDNTAHLNFSDAPLWTPLFQLVGAAGSIDGRRGIEVTNAYTHAFFARHLLGEADPLLDPGA